MKLLVGFCAMCYPPQTDHLYHHPPNLCILCGKCAHILKKGWAHFPLQPMNWHDSKLKKKYLIHDSISPIKIIIFLSSTQIQTPASSCPSNVVHMGRHQRSGALWAPLAAVGGGSFTKYIGGQWQLIIYMAMVIFVGKTAPISFLMRVSWFLIRKLDLLFAFPAYLELVSLVLIPM